MAEKRTATREPVADRLIDTASALFYQEGIQSVGVQRVIDEAGIAKASLYAHFPSKDDLVAACLERRAASWQEIVQREVLDSPFDAPSGWRARISGAVRSRMPAVSWPM
jgi:AcrR family transcriptional regulator